MFSFKGFFTRDKNTHLEHLEDDIINRGAVDGENAINFLKAVRNMLAGSGKGTNMTVNGTVRQQLSVVSILKMANSLSELNQYSIKLLKLTIL